MKKYPKICFIFLLIWGYSTQAPSYAQPAPQTEAVAPAATATPAAAPETTAATGTTAGTAPAGNTATDNIDIQKTKFTDSLFFSTIEITLIRQAQLGKPTNTATLEAPVPAPGKIEISGILYRGPDDWIVWVNGRQVTPNALLPEMVDIKVSNSSTVSFKWYDVNRKIIIPVTMRPRQVYDVETGKLMMTGL